MNEKLEASLRDLISHDNFEEATKLLEFETMKSRSGLGKEITALRGELTRLKTEYRRRLITHDEYTKHRTRLGYALLDIASEGIDATHSTRNRVFLSYNHNDRDIAFKLKTAIEERGFTVRIDAEAMEPGADIRSFILESIRQTDITLCIISEKSLLSGWVSVESLIALTDEELHQKRRFIACYLDDEFFKPEFRLKATDLIDAKLEGIDKLFPQYREKRLDTTELNNDKSRLFDLRNNLGKVLKKIKESLSLDIRSTEFEQSIKRLGELLQR